MINSACLVYRSPAQRGGRVEEVLAEISISYSLHRFDSFVLDRQKSSQYILRHKVRLTAELEVEQPEQKIEKCLACASYWVRTLTDKHLQKTLLGAEQRKSSTLVFSSTTFAQGAGGW